MGLVYLNGHSHRNCIWAGKDVFDGAVCLSLAYSRPMDEVLWCLGECWKDRGIPEQVQFDNAREVVGWGPAARTPSRVIRMSLRFGVSLVFYPAGQPHLADIYGGHAVAEERLSELHDALSVRTGYRCNEIRVHRSP